MKTFVQKNLLTLHTSKERNRRLKNLTLFFLGASATILVTNALTINPNITNSIMVMRDILLTNNGNPTGTTGVFLNGVNGSVNAIQYCDQNGTGCKTIANIGGSQWQTNGTAISYISGNVGIGTNNPTAKLDVKGATSLKDVLKFDGAGGDSAHDIEFYSHTGRSRVGLLGYYWNNVFGGTMGIFGPKGVLFGTLTGTQGMQGPINTMYLSADGKLGIGTENPSEKLEVGGNILISASTAGRQERKIYIQSKAGAESDDLTIQASDSTAGDHGGDIKIQAGNGTGANTPMGGMININAGNSRNDYGGDINIKAGIGLLGNGVINLNGTTNLCDVNGGSCQPLSAGGGGGITNVGGSCLSVDNPFLCDASSEGSLAYATCNATDNGRGNLYLCRSTPSGGCGGTCNGYSRVRFPN